jgi:hypothetical protein
MQDENPLVDSKPKEERRLQLLYYNILELLQGSISKEIPADNYR